MPTPEQDVQEVRSKRTIWLMAGAAVSLILPLLGIVYIKMNEAKTARTPSSVMFDRRESGESKISITQAVTILNPATRTGSAASPLPVKGGQMAPPPAPGGSSLDFVKGGANNAYFQDKTVSPAASTPSAAAAPAPEPEPAPKTAAKKGGKKAFNMPKLQGVKGFSSFKGASPKANRGRGVTDVAAPQAGNGDADMTDMLKNMPGGVNNPEVQKYLKSQGK